MCLLSIAILTQIVVVTDITDKALSEDRLLMALVAFNAIVIGARWRQGLAVLRFAGLHDCTAEDIVVGF